MELHEKIDRLTEIQEEMEELIWEVSDLVRGTCAEDRAESYWMAHIKMALSNNNGYLGGSMVTMADTIEELKENG